MSSDYAARAIFLGLFALTLYLVYRIFLPFLPGIAWAIVLSVVFEPIYTRLVRLLRGREMLAAILLSTLVAAFIVVPAVLIVMRVAQGLVGVYTWLEQEVRSGQLLARLQDSSWAGRALAWVDEHAKLGDIDLQAMALSAVKAAGAALASRTGAIVANALETVLGLLVVLLTMTVLFPARPRLVAAVRRYLPLSEKDKDEVLAELRDVTRAVFYGVGLTALVQAVLAAIGFFIAGVPNALVLGAVLFIFALLPGGPTLIWGPAAVWLFATGHPGRGVFLVVWGMIIVGTADNVVRPIFIGRGVKLHMMLVFFGTLGGLMTFGLLGLFIGPLIITAFLAFLEVARRGFFPDERRPGAAGLPPERVTE